MPSNETLEESSEVDLDSIASNETLEESFLGGGKLAD
jgi:hypothetical protein